MIAARHPRQLKQVQTQLVETVRPVVEKMIQQVACVKPLGLHHDISTVSGGDAVLLTLADPPSFRPNAKKKWGRRIAEAPHRTRGLAKASGVRAPSSEGEPYLVGPKRA